MTSDLFCSSNFWAILRIRVHTRQYSSLLLGTSLELTTKEMLVLI